ncbi:MAG: hypothetical protein IJE84_06210, partial [Clostridia bacterium]|nr:hypothetical protein [Clostridia bacterium]
AVKSDDPISLLQVGEGGAKRRMRMSIKAEATSSLSKVSLKQAFSKQEKVSAELTDEDADQSITPTRAIESADSISLLQVGEGGAKRRMRMCYIKTI